MSDTERPHHSNGVCLSCGGMVDESGMARGGEVEAESTDEVIVGPVAPDDEELAEQNARDFARAVNGGR